ncbi:alpha/beta hydrolase family protein [Amycolatopsis echigonensis]|uniref:Alpha/beta fold hydrolase n=1 Tax=Amycolatopsis echigonensis TaxID=2576905 RepID=A0A8E1W1B0_9PSEU|nr:alpha/beta fold hydrolase [Amycolatopsis echigonensis]MBB2501904.1 alpha/beta fold hydrolase [Amycolatopsis echigonensis]
MKPLLFEDDPQFWFETLIALGQIAYGGADFGEVVSIASNIKSGDYDSWHDAWLAGAERLYAEAATMHPISARDAYLRASTYYRRAEFFLHGNPDDPRINYAYERNVESFQRAVETIDHVEPIEIPYDGHVLRGYFYRAPGDGPKPLLVVHNGFDGSAEDLHFMGATAGQERGYHVLTFDGPGQPSAVHRDGLKFRPDWEHVVSQVLDYALALPDVVPEKVALIGWSLGGMLAPRAAAFEPRLSAVVAVDGLFDAGAAFLEQLPWDRAETIRRANAPEDAELDAVLAAAKEQNPTVRWALSHGRYVMGGATDREFLAKYLEYHLDDGVAERITCPALICDAPEDLFFTGQPQQLYDRISGPKKLLNFTSEEGAEAHCHIGAMRLANGRIYDWLDDVL